MLRRSPPGILTHSYPSTPRSGLPPMSSTWTTSNSNTDTWVHYTLEKSLIISGLYTTRWATLSLLITSMISRSRIHRSHGRSRMVLRRHRGWISEQLSITDLFTMKPCAWFTLDTRMILIKPSYASRMFLLFWLKLIKMRTVPRVFSALPKVGID